MPVWWVYVQTANFVFWNVLAVTAQDDYFTHDCVDALRRLGVPHNRRSALYRFCCGWWPKDFWHRTAAVTAVWTVRVRLTCMTHSYSLSPTPLLNAGGIWRLAAADLHGHATVP